jgi:hypothetical protein
MWIDIYVYSCTSYNNVCCSPSKKTGFKCLLEDVCIVINWLYSCWAAGVNCWCRIISGPIECETLGRYFVLVKKKDVPQLKFHVEMLHFERKK